MGLKEGGLRGSLRNVGTGVSAILDSGDLHARYDFSQEDGTMPVTDRTGNGHDLTNGSYTGIAASINGVQAGEFDGADDSVWGGTFAAISPPYTIFFVAEASGGGSNIDAVFNGTSSDTLYVGYDYGNSEVSAFDGPGGPLSGGSLTDTLVGNLRTGGTDSTLRTMGNEVATGTEQSADMDVIGLGSQEPKSSQRFFDGSIGEVLVYPMDKSGIQSDVEQYLADKWGITI